MIKAGVIGWPISQSKSPIIHNHWLDFYKIKGTYKKISMSSDDLERGIRDLISHDYIGLNVTLPHKENVLQICDVLSDRAKNIGAVNTLLFKNGFIYGDNTDGEGFINNLMQEAPNWNAALGPALVLGAGGAARAIISALIEAGVPNIILVNRTLKRAENLAYHFGHKITVADWEDKENIVGFVSILVNTTVLGMNGKDPLIFLCDNLKSDTLVTDIVYNPLKTNLLQRAEKKGCPVVDGLGMLLHQAVPGFYQWFGVRPVVNEILRKKVLIEL